MGVAVSRRADVRATEQIEKEIEIEKINIKTQVKLLLLGPGESGKSTILKQIQTLHKIDDSVRVPKEVVWRCIFESMATIMEFMRSATISLEDQELEVQESLVLQESRKHEEDKDVMNSEEMYRVISSLWSDAGVQEAFERRSEFQLSDSTQYFFSDLERVCAVDYEPTKEDALRVRIPTAGIAQLAFESRGFQFRVFDVGGQKSQRRKWIHVFDDANAIMFLVAMSEYDQVLREDFGKNRMQDSLELFENMIRNEHFKTTAILLFLNKKDIFAEKIVFHSIKSAFPNYDGPQNYDACMKYIQQQFLNVETTDREIRTFETCATDPTVHQVIEICEGKIIEKALGNAGTL